MKKFPEAKHLSRSWIVYGVDGKPVCEFFSRANAKAAFDIGLRVELVGTHLANLNREIKNDQTR